MRRRQEKLLTVAFAGLNAQWLVLVVMHYFYYQL